jgi:cell wall-associated NlpC family hydrolase
MTEAEERAAVIAEAWTWVKTPFRHQSDVKAGGVDCAMWLVRTFVDLGIIEPFDPRWSSGVPGVGEKTGYPRLWFLHKDEERYLGWLNHFADEITAEEARPGDVVIYKHGMCFSHAGLIISDRQLIHAWFKEEQVTPCERFLIELTRYGDDTPSLSGTPRPVKYFNAWKRKRRLAAAAPDRASL